jgi:hypothetical protein
VPFVVSACGYRQAQRQDTDPHDFDTPLNRWIPGVSLDNFS